MLHAKINTCMLYVCACGCRYADYAKQEGQALGLLEGILHALQSLRESEPQGKDMSLQVFWLENTNYLKNLLHQYSPQQVAAMATANALTSCIGCS